MNKVSPTAEKDILNDEEFFYSKKKLIERLTLQKYVMQCPRKEVILAHRIQHISNVIVGPLRFIDQSVFFFIGGTEFTHDQAMH